MSDLRVNNIVAEGGASAPLFQYGFQVPTGYGVTGAGGINITGIITANSAGLTGTLPAISGANLTSLTGANISGALAAVSGSSLTGVVTTAAAASSQTVAGSLIFSGDAQVGGALTVVGNMTVDGTQTIINTTTLDVADKTVGLGSTTAATNTTAAGAGIEIYASSATANNNKTILWQNTSNCFEFSENVKLKGVNETSINNGSTGVQTYINGTSLVLELDLETGTVFNYTSPTVAAAADAGGIGIVSFKNMPANAQNVQTVTLVHTQGKGTAGMGNTLPVQGIGITCRVIPKSGGSAVAGIMTRGWCGGGIGAASTVVCSGDGGTAGNVSGNVDIISFMVHYTGGTNTDLNSYKVYVSGNTGFNQGSFGV
tara:strand:+ start:4961 stop:6073 length:1113 start_codon:yes stop_codon:yes gene_type:complete